MSLQAKNLSGALAAALLAAALFILPGDLGSAIEIYNSPAVRELMLGYDLLASGDLEKAVEHLSRAVALDRKNPYLKKVYAEALFRTGDFQQALEVLKPFEKQLDSVDAQTLKMIAVGYESNGDKSRAITLYKLMLEREPEDSQVRRHLLSMLNDAGRFQEMIPIFKPLLDDPEEQNYAWDLYHLGALYYRIGGRQTAKEYLEKSLEADSTLAEPHILLAGINEFSQNWDAALKHYLRSLELKPEAAENLFDRVISVAMKAEDLQSPIAFLEKWVAAGDSSAWARERLGTLYYHDGKVEQAAGLLEPLAENNQLTSSGNFVLGFMLSSQKKFPEAARAFQAVQKDRPDFIPVYLALGRVYRLMDRQDDAYGVFAEGLELTPKQDNYNRRELTFALADVCHEKGDYDKTEEYLKKVVKDNPDFAPALNYLGYFYAERGIKLGEAQRMINRALEQEPANGHYIDSMGWVLFKMGQPEKALEYIKDSLNKLGDHPEVLDHLGDIYNALGEREKARQAWEKSLDLKSDNSEIKKKIELLKTETDSRGSVHK